ncbi:IclR family transcriptional regulator [Paenarthrobacter nitroguajacolicus]|uniref:IclR family transcriptional regulator n=1 Tax=Paenarthrobacter nitroguajacolicus TaxID=211146 RepID=UPI0015BEFB1B|nr:IclR family transcriptional regulator [Paenarthrobacter nitroguajacolicus]NWL10332.1 IclR family transcriptional regulator [Paenarthrobacter nitroguajacolicus]
MSQTVARAIDVVTLVSLASRSLGEVADHLKVHKSTALRLLQTLEEGGFVRRLGDGRYGMGFELIALGQIALDQVEARSLAHAHLQGLASKTGHTVHFGQLIGNQVIYIDKVDGHGTVAMGSRIGLTAKINTASVAKAIAAYQSDSVRAKLLVDAVFERYTRTTLATRQELIDDLDRTRARGWAEDDGEYEEYINCIALPVYDARGSVTYGISITALRAVASLDDLRGQLPLFRDVAHHISQNLGWKGHEWTPPNSLKAI